MKKVLLRAPLLTNSGYGVHSRQIFVWLKEESKKRNFVLDVECLNWGNCSWMIEKSLEGGLVGEIMNRSKPLEKKYDVTFQVQLPDEWNPALGNYNIGVTAAVETDRCNPDWIKSANNMDEIVVPSTFTKNVMKRSGVLMKNIHVIPEWFNEEITNLDHDEGLELDLKSKFNFLIVGMLTGASSNTDRKNIVNTISYLCEKFKDNPEVGIVVKTSMGKYSSFDKKRTQAYFDQLVEKCRPDSQFPKINLLYGSMTKKDMARLYKSKDIQCYVTLTRAEGYGLPIIEAAASGLPIIATNYSGHLEFIGRQEFLPVDYKLVEIPKEKVDKRIFVKNTRWAEPDKNSFFTKLDDMYNNYSLHKQNAKKIQNYITENYSSKACIEIYNRKFGDILQ